MAMPRYPGPTAEEVRRIREETGCSMMDAKKQIETLWYRENMNKIMGASVEEKVQFLMELALIDKI